MNVSMYRDQLVYIALRLKGKLQRNVNFISITEQEFINYANLVMQEAKKQDLVIRIVDGEPKIQVDDANMQKKLDSFKYKKGDSGYYYFIRNEVDPRVLLVKTSAGLDPIIMQALTPKGYEATLGLKDKLAAIDENTDDVTIEQKTHYQPGEEE